MAGIAREVKNEIILKVKSGVRVVELSKQYGVSEQTIYAWLKQKVEGSVSVLEHTKLRKENEQLKQMVISTKRNQSMIQIDWYNAKNHTAKASDIFFTW
jgi:transposase-like protein